ncbi:MAG: M81 family metallopeptidase, partial [Acidimicrobiia bacterium]|nr:M81 family metallopeptidase [Acidimicrobiia bacterium]
MTRRVVVAMMEHETNTFSPVPTPLERFGRGGFGVPTGPEVVERFRGTGTGLGGLLDVALDAGYRAGSSVPSGRSDPATSTAPTTSRWCGSEHATAPASRCR